MARKSRHEPWLSQDRRGMSAGAGRLYQSSGTASHGAPSTGAKRIAIVGPSGMSILRLRGPLIRDLIARRHHVLCVAPEIGETDAVGLRELGAEPQLWVPKPTRLKILADANAIAALRDIFSGWRPHVVMGFGTRAMILAALAARRSRVPRIINLVNGLPEGGIGALRDVDGVTNRRYRQAFDACDGAVFHNGYDARQVFEAGLLPPDLSVTTVSGAGIDLERRPVIDLPPLGQGLTFLMIARLDRSKGVLEYCEAARVLKRRAPQARFLLAGPEGSGASGLAAAALDLGSGAVEYLGPVDEVRDLIALCHVYVFPSHAEGMAPSILEALAAGRPIITTETPGCRETVDERVNGCLVPVGDSMALAAAIESFLKRPDLIPSAARASRLKAERRFDQRVVNATLLAMLGVA